MKAGAPRLVAPTLSDQQLDEMLGLIGYSDSVELKLTVPESDQYATVGALGMDPLEAQLRQVFFFDTPDLALNKRGLVVRARRVQRKSGGDAIVKVRPVVPSELPAKLRRSPLFNVEVDAMPGGFVCSGTLKRRVENTEVRRVVNGVSPLGSLLSKSQRALVAQHAPDGVELEDLSMLGPILVLKLKFESEAFGRLLVAELWLYPDNSRVLELSTKCAPGEAFQVAAEARVFLSRQGVDLSGDQEAKTLKTLNFFSARLAATAAS
jgi:hypothetical protein